MPLLFNCGKVLQKTAEPTGNTDIGRRKTLQEQKKRTGKANNDTGNPGKNVKHFTTQERRSP